MPLSPAGACSNKVIVVGNLYIVQCITRTVTEAIRRFRGLAIDLQPVISYLLALAPDSLKMFTLQLQASLRRGRCTRNKSIWKTNDFSSS